MKKDDFIGKSAMEEAGAPKIKRVGLKVTGRGIIREDQTVYAEDASGSGRPTKKSVTPLPAPIAHSWANRCGMALIDKEYAEVGTKLIVDVDGRMVEGRDRTSAVLHKSKITLLYYA